MSELSLDFSAVPGSQVVESYTIGPVSRETRSTSGPTEGEQHTTPLEDRLIGPDPAELVKVVIEKFPQALEKASSQTLRERKVKNRWQVAAVVAGSIAIGAITTLSASNNTPQRSDSSSEVTGMQPEEIASPVEQPGEMLALSAEQLDKIAKYAGISTYRLLESNGVEASATISEDTLQYRDGGIIAELRGEREELAVRFEQGLTLSHLGQGIAVVRGDVALRPHLLGQLTSLNPHAAESFVAGQKIVLPSDITREEALQVMHEIDEGCEITPKLGDDAVIEVNMEELQDKIGQLTQACGRNPQTVSSQMLQRNPSLMQNGQISFEGKAKVVVPFGEQIIRGGN